MRLLLEQVRQALGAESGMTPVPFTPGVRSMLVVGLLDGVLSLNTEKSAKSLCSESRNGFSSAS